MTTFAATLGMEYIPFYIGKGTNARCFDTDRNGGHRKVVQKLAKLGKKPLVYKIKEHLTEAEALQLEAKLIDIFGLLPHSGYLTNLDEGHNATERRQFYNNSFTQLRNINKAMYVTV